MEWRKVITAVIAAWVATAGVHADMVAEAGIHPGPQTEIQGPSRSDAAPLAPLLLIDGFRPVDLASLPFGAVSEESDQAEPADDTPQPLVLRDRQDSMTLCLYALMGFALCKSAPWVKRFSFGTLPEWYHDGGPVQVGHSLAISPNCIPTAAFCFVQPEAPLEDIQPDYRQETVVCLWRISQFTPTQLAARAPPRMS